MDTMIDPRLFKIYDRKLPRSGMNGHLAFLYSLVIGTRARTVVEIGVRYGGSTSALILGLANSKQGCLYSFDIVDCPDVRKRVTEWGLDYLWNFTAMDSQKVTWDQPIDILFIDGDHFYAGAKADYVKFEPFVKQGGFILMHDTKPSTSHNYSEVKDFLPEVTYPYITLPYGEGLTIIQKVRAK